MMRRVVRLAVVVGATLLVLGLAGLAYVRTTGLIARSTPSAIEARLGRGIRSFAIPGSQRTRQNPVPRSDDALAAALQHYADHCAVCHANDGSGNTDFGRGLFPPPPDLRAQPTQALTDGELFWIIENGIRFTGMPAFGTGTAEGEEESWRLVHFTRHLPRLTESELERMKGLNPRSPEEIRLEIEEERFLRGDEVR
jgi:mono/diheme cytochrome c family protein